MITTFPAGTSWWNILSMACLAGICLTMSIFITQLAFSDELFVQSAKMMILAASSISALIGITLFKAKL